MVGGIAGVILPSSILSNSGIYTKAREIILQYFDIVAIAELGSNTFMATNTNTVVLFLRRRDNYFAANTKNAVDTFFRTLNDVTINGIETPASKYVAHVWDGIDYADYVTLLQKSPNDKIKAHEIYAEYKKKISAKSEAKLYEAILSIEAEKLLYYVLAYPQKVVIVKSGEKDIEKRFLGYEFSNRRGNEGIHAIQKGKNIDECTKLFDANSYDNPEKASTYVYKAFKGDYTTPIAEGMQTHVSRISLIDMLTFDRYIFEKGINLNSKKKVVFNCAYTLKPLDKLVNFQSGLWKGEKGLLQVVKVLRNTNFKLNNGFLDYGDVAEIEVETTQLATRTLQYGDIILEKSGGSDTQAIGRVVLFDKNDNETYSYSNFCSRVRVKDTSEVNSLYLWIVLHNFYCKGGTIPLQNGIRLLNIDMDGYSKIKIPVPPIDIQKQIVEEICKVDKSVSSAMQQIKKLEKNIEDLLSSINFKDGTLNAIAPFATKSIKYNDIDSETYITTDNMLQNKLGIIPFEGEANISSITEYKNEDILISNIRPYLKKIWFADKKGGCSKDVLVLRSADTSKYLPKYIFYMLSRDVFFDYIMESKKGIKMPRGNKEDILKYRIPIPSPEEQQRIVSKVEELEAKIKVAREVIENAASQKQTVLDRYL
nr:restriction endonuclease subunit S [Bacteroides sp. AM37-9]